MSECSQPTKLHHLQPKSERLSQPLVGVSSVESDGADVVDETGVGLLGAIGVLGDGGEDSSTVTSQITDRLLASQYPISMDRVSILILSAKT